MAVRAKGLGSSPLCSSPCSSRQLRHSAEDVSGAPHSSTGEVHGAASDETRAARDVDPSEASAIARSGSSAPEQRAKPLDPAQRGLLPFIILKSIERPFTMSPPR
ncbi:MAG TPA: hypothetical protein VGU20_12785 [Stellaceae bacterium]|nr:hypothetical protein [Stellaceae bacterium]